MAQVTAVLGQPSPTVRLYRPSWEPGIAENVKFWPAWSYTQCLLESEWYFSQIPTHLVSKETYMAQALIDVHEWCKKVEKSSGQTTKKPTRSHLLHCTRPNKLAGVIPVLSGRGNLCVSIPFC